MTTTPSSEGGASAPTVAPEPGGADPTTAGSPDRCHTSELTGDLVSGDAAAGQRGATLTLTNTGGETCTVFGYGGLGLQDGAGADLPTTQDGQTSSPPHTVTLQSGQTVSATITWTVIPTGDETCQPTPETLQVIPPDETDPLTVDWAGGGVCDAGSLTQTAYVAA